MPAALNGLFAGVLPLNLLLPLWDHFLVSDDRRLGYFLTLALLTKHANELLGLKADRLRRRLAELLSLKTIAADAVAEAAAAGLTGGAERLLGRLDVPGGRGNVPWRRRVRAALLKELASVHTHNARYRAKFSNFSILG